MCHVKLLSGVPGRLALLLASGVAAASTTMSACAASATDKNAATPLRQPSQHPIA
jgi:hypothetical protein